MENNAFPADANPEELTIYVDVGRSTLADGKLLNFTDSNGNKLEDILTWFTVGEQKDGEYNIPKLQDNLQINYVLSDEAKELMSDYDTKKNFVSDNLRKRDNHYSGDWSGYGLLGSMSAIVGGAVAIDGDTNGLIRLVAAAVGAGIFLISYILGRRSFRRAKNMHTAFYRIITEDKVK